MKTLLSILLLTITLNVEASPIMQGGRSVYASTCNPSTSCYIKRLWALGTRQSHNNASGILLGAVYANIPAGCWLEDSNKMVVYKMRYYLRYSDNLQSVAKRAFKDSIFMCQ